LTEVNVYYLQRTEILEGVERNRGVKWKFFISTYEASSMVGGESETWDLREGRVEIFQIGLRCCLCLL
jgi:hypothetical protein